MGNSGEIELQVLICTIGAEGIKRICSTPRPEVPGVEYLICWQQPDTPIPVPEELEARNDIRIVIHQSKGLSRNRNCAMAASSAPLCLIGDDDVAYDAKGLKALMQAFRTNPDVDIICMRYTCNGSYVKPYGDTPFSLKKAPKGWYITSFEIAYRRESPAGGTVFCEQLGLGAPLLRAGEEDVWLYDSIQAGAKGVFMPIDIGEHDHPTTAERHQSEEWLIMTHGAVLSHIHPRSWLPRCMVHSLRQHHRSCLSYTFLCLKGAWHARRHRMFRKK